MTGNVLFTNILAYKFKGYDYYSFLVINLHMRKVKLLRSQSIRSSLIQGLAGSPLPQMPLMVLVLSKERKGHSGVSVCGGDLTFATVFILFKSWPVGLCAWGLGKVWGPSV